VWIRLLEKGGTLLRVKRFVAGVGASIEHVFDEEFTSGTGGRFWAPVVGVKHFEVGILVPRPRHFRDVAGQELKPLAEHVIVVAR
jgi:hypothetical protein